MTTETKPEVWMIAISDNPISQYYKEVITPTWTDRGFKVNHFEAKTPKDLDIDCNFLPFTQKLSNKHKCYVDFTDTEKAVWYSHYFAWQKCWDEQTPIIVVEHDIRLLKDIDPKLFMTNIACLAHDERIDDFGKVYGRPKLAGGAYYLNPLAARELMRIRHHKKIIYNSDAWIHRTCDKYGRWDEFTCVQYKNDAVGVTIQHNHPEIIETT